MTRWTSVVFAVVGMSQLSALADCPSDAIFCDNFNTYCTGGGYPGGAGDPADPDCASATSPDNALLRSVWFQTSIDELTSAPCGENIIVDPASPISTPPESMPPNYQALSSFPFAARTPGLGTEFLGQETVKDWVSPNPLNLSRLIGNAFGSGYTAVAATDANPLVTSFFVSSKGGPTGFSGRIWYSDGYMELAYGDETYMNRANTDYGLVANPPSSPLCCSPTISQGPFPVICANGNPDDPSVALPLNCPLPASTAPVHNAIAVGIFANLDNNPCHCNTAHGGTLNHPALFDGKLWYQIKKNNPMPSTGWVTLLDGTPVPTPPNDLDTLSQAQYKYGNFTLYGGQPATMSGKSLNWIKLTVKATTFSIEMKSQEVSRSNGVEYLVYSSMDNIPRQYLGPFDRLRAGVGPGCELDSSSSWTTCKSGTGRTCIKNNGNQSFYVDFDDFTLTGGVGYSTVGSCCHSNGTCTEEAPENCQAPGDQHGGGNTSCATATCCSHGTYVWADADADGDVDVDDFGRFQRCFTGPEGAMLPDLKCKCFDRGNDNHVDGSDYLEFAKCATGATVPWSPALTPFCTP